MAFLYVHAPRGHIYLRFLCAIPVFVAEHGLGSRRYPSYVLEAVRPAVIPPSSYLFQRESLSDWISWRVSISISFLSECRFELFHTARRFHLLQHVSPSRQFFSACVALQLAISGVSRFQQFHGIFRILLSILYLQRVSLISLFFHGLRRLQVVFTACVAFRLFSRRVSPSSQPFQRVSLISCFHGVCRLQVVSMACVAFQLAISACVAYKLFSWRVSPSGCFYGVCRLQVVFTACVTLQLAISSVCRL